VSEKIIYCSGCQLYLGKIQKAHLRKNIVFLCEKCETIRYKNHNAKSSDDLYKDIFGTNFNDIFKK